MKEIFMLFLNNFYSKILYFVYFCFFKVHYKIGLFGINLFNRQRLKIIKIKNKVNIYKLYDHKDFIYISSINRIVKYTSGIKARLLNLANCYFLDDIQFKSGDVIIDVGANIGEIYKYFEYFLKLKIKYYAFEPNPSDFNALKMNVNGKLWNIGILDKNSELNFNVLTDTADSNFIESKDRNNKTIIVKTMKLDSIKFPKKIKLIKIDTESLEYEVLKCGKETLKKTEFVSIDVSDESSGLDFLNYKKNIVNFLKKNFFSIKGEYFYNNRNCILFKNKKLSKF